MQLIFGANGAAGRAYIRTLAANTSDVVAVLRVPAQDDFLNQRNIRAVCADALDRAALDSVFAQYRPDTVISFIGGKNEQGIRSDAIGNINLIQATEAVNLNARLILVTSMGCGEQWDGMSEPFKQALGEAVLAKTEAENVLQKSDLKWTILRPCGLNNDEENGYTLSENFADIPVHYMSRNGLASAINAVLASDTHIGKIYTVGAAAR